MDLNATEVVASAVTEDSLYGVALADVMQAFSKNQAVAHRIVAAIIGKFYGQDFLG